MFLSKKVFLEDFYDDTKKCFGAYDIRGIVPEEVNEELAYRMGKFFLYVRPAWAHSNG